MPKTLALPGLAQKPTAQPVVTAKSLPQSATPSTLVDGPHFMIIFDTSASMKDADGTGSVKIDSAKTIISDLLGRMTEKRVNVSVVNYDGCRTNFLARPTAEGFRQINDAVMRTEPTGSTPLAQSIIAVETIVRNNKNRSTIVIVSDGKESCGGNACAEASRLKQDYLTKFKIYTIGYDVNKQTQKELKCVASAAGGSYMAAKNPFALETSLHKIVAREVTAEFDSDFDGVTNDKDKCPRTLPGFTVDKHGCETRYTVRVNFDVGSDVIKPVFDKSIKRFADYLKGHRKKSIIVGHTDGTGDRAINISLSKRRARAVVARLIKLGVPQKSLTFEGLGPDKPIANNQTSVGRYRNRRVEARILR